jgi:hypothetical protein
LNLPVPADSSKPGVQKLAKATTAAFAGRLKDLSDL